MNKLARIAIGAVAIFGFSVAALFVDMQLGLKADTEACPKVQVSDAVEAVIQNVINPSNRIFADHHLSANDVMVNPYDVQVGTSAILVPFRLSKGPDRQFFGMPRCSDLSSIEYASD
ncbi:hypothetical protein [Erwinia sp.]|uniref:hypothetical protein n=1 Tax=Erwinia citreus TaxID=558 RepID=UPI003C7483D7